MYPLLLDEVAGKNTMRVYFILYHEATIVNLFEILLYHKHVCESIGEKMIEFVDYCSRKLTRLNGGYDFRALEPAATAATSTDKMKEYSKSLEVMSMYFYDSISFFLSFCPSPSRMISCNLNRNRNLV